MALRVELQGDEGDLSGDPGHHGLHRLVLGDAHVLERSWQENHPVCDREGGYTINHIIVYHSATVSAQMLSWKGLGSIRDCMFSVLLRFFDHKYHEPVQ